MRRFRLEQDLDELIDRSHVKKCIAFDRTKLQAAGKVRSARKNDPAFRPYAAAINAHIDRLNARISLYTSILNTYQEYRPYVLDSPHQSFRRQPLDSSCARFLRSPFSVGPSESDGAMIRSLRDAFSLDEYVEYGKTWNSKRSKAKVADARRVGRWTAPNAFRVDVAYDGDSASADFVLESLRESIASVLSREVHIKHETEASRIVDPRLCAQHELVATLKNVDARVAVVMEYGASLRTTRLTRGTKSWVHEMHVWIDVDALRRLRKPSPDGAAQTKAVVDSFDASDVPLDAPLDVPALICLETHFETYAYARGFSKTPLDDALFTALSRVDLLSVQYPNLVRYMTMMTQNIHK